MSSSSNSSSNSYSSRVLEWELGLPSDEDLTPISQTLIPPSLASAFSISVDEFTVNVDVGARPSKRPRVSWTPQLHGRFLEVVSRLGTNNAVPKTIVEMMNVEGLTRENVASHLQKYRMYVKRVGADSLNPDPDTARMMMTGFHSYRGN